ncbi:UNVERIFIED_CONTAM: hypothetical protein Sindi_2655200 [Sesamum indicum]
MLKGGDQCSRVFFRKIAQRRSSRRIFQINDDQGSTHTNPEEVINEFVTYYKNLLGGDRRRTGIDIRFLRPWARHILSNEESTALLLPFTPADVKQAVFDITEDKASGPDGYSSGFFKVAWPIVGHEVTSAILDFFSPGLLLKQINTTLLVLIPKVHSPMTVSDFRPIACCNVLYKIIAKLIVQRLSVIMDKLISPCQATFLPGRSIGDNIMLAQELFMGDNQTRLPPRCALKVDIRKMFGFPIISRSTQALREEMLALLGFQEGVLPMRYLGLPLISSRLTIADSRPLLLKIDKRIAGWEGTTISYAGRVQIIKSVLIALSLYWASAFILPKKVINEIKKRLRAFLWKGTTNSGYAKVFFSG